MARPAAACARDILDRIDKIETYVGGMSREAFLADSMRREAVERNVEIISEASRGLPDDLKDNEYETPWRAIADLGNVYRHEYGNVDPEMLWDTATVHVPALRAPVQRIHAALRTRVHNEPPP